MRSAFRLVAALALAIAPTFAARQSYENAAITRTVSLGGSISQSTTVYNIKSLEDIAGDYELALGEKGDQEPVWWEVMIAGKKLVPQPTVLVAPNSPPTISIPTTMTKGASLTLTVNTQLLHRSIPRPASIAQDDPQLLLFQSPSTWVETPYVTNKQTIKFRAPSGKIISHSKASQRYIRDQDAKKAGASLTLGPYYNVPATTEGGFEQHPIEIHYPTQEPVLAIKSFNRSVDVAWWGKTIKVQDDVALVNDGPELKGHFSRLLFQMAKFRPSYPAQILREITYPLPPSSHDAWFTDTIGNVSTSHFRPSPKTGSAPAVLELRPRYPLMGGWKYEFSVGWDMDLSRFLRHDASSGRETIRVPFTAGLRDVAADEVRLSVILPEGVTDVRWTAPFHVSSVEQTTFRRHLDTIGRPQLIIRKNGCTDKHDQDIEISFHYPTTAKYQKVYTVLGLLAGVVGLRIASGLLDKSVKRLARSA